KNYQKQKIKVAKIREKIANQRTDILNKITTELVSSYDVICIEKAHHSNERPPKHDRSELAWSLFLAKLLYKAQWYGKELICIESEEIETELSFSESTENSEYLRSQKILERGLSKRETL
ncbi:transposase, partial [Enterococcus faecalis]